MLKNKALWILSLWILLLLSACSSPSLEQNKVPEMLAEPRQTNHETVAVTMGVYCEQAKGSASVYHPVSAELTWDGGNAYLREINVKKGQKVKKGDILAVFEVEISGAQKTELELQLQRKEEAFAAGKQTRMAAIKEAKANLRDLTSAQRELAMLELEKQEVSYAQYVYQREREIASARERLNALLQTQADNTLVAPFDGIIRSVASHQVGDKIDKDEVVVSMYSEEEFFLQVSNAEGKLRHGMEVTIETGRANDKKSFTGVVVAAPNILPASLKQSVAYIRVDENITVNDFQNTIQFFCNVKYLEDVLVADSKGVYREDGKFYGNIREDGAIKKRYVTVGLTNTDSSWILNGLREGQLLIVE